MSTRSTIHPFALGTIALVSLAACSSSEDLKRSSGNSEDAGTETPPRPVDVTRPAFQAKSAAQLTKSIEACVGKNASMITETMVASEANPAAFLTSDFAVGTDIVEVQKGLFDGQAASLRTGVRVDQITLEYLTALKNVANVVGSRCAAGLVENPALCKCATEADAKAMIARCLGAVADPNTPEAAALARSLATKCVTDPGSGIASMLASLAFAKVP